MSQTTTLDWIRWGSAAVSDALRQQGHCFAAMESVIKPIAPDMAVAGPAFTVRCYPGATWALEESLERAQPGDVLVVDGGAATDLILMGELMSRRAQQRGIAGAVIDGAVRDVDAVIAFGFPLFSRAVACRAGVHEQVGEWQTTICCGRLPVNSGDWVVADRNGIVVVPADRIDATAQAAQAIHACEQRIAAHLADGHPLAEAARQAKSTAAPTGS